MLVFTSDHVQIKLEHHTRPEYISCNCASRPRLQSQLSTVNFMLHQASSKRLSLFVLQLEYKHWSGIKYNMIEASIMQFNLTSDNILYYNLRSNLQQVTPTVKQINIELIIILQHLYLFVSVLQFLAVKLTLKL